MSDLISRQAAFDEIIWNSDNGVIDAKVAIEALRKLPSVEPERKPGKWKIISTLQSTRGFFAECSNCKEIVFGGGKYCKECGAKMEV